MYNYTVIRDTDYKVGPFFGYYGNLWYDIKGHVHAGKGFWSENMKNMSHKPW